MAKLTIEADVTGLNSVKQLDNAVKDLGTTTQQTTTTTVAMGNVYANLASQVSQAFFSMVNAGVEYRNTLDEINGVTNTIEVRSEKLSTSFGALSDSIFDLSDNTSLWSKAMNELQFTMDWWTAFFNDTTITKQKAVNEQVRLHAENTKLDAIALKEATQALADYDRQLQAEKRIELARLDAEATAEASQALQHYNNQLKQQAEDEREATKAMREAEDAFNTKVDNIKKVNDALIELNLTQNKYGRYVQGDSDTATQEALGNKLNELALAGATDAELQAIYKAEMSKQTEATKEVTKAVEKQTQQQQQSDSYESPNFTEAGAYEAEATPYGARSGGRRDYYTPTGGSWGLRGKERPSWYGSQHFTGTLQAPEQRIDTSAERLAEARRKTAEKELAEALEKVNEELALAEANLIKWTDFLVASTAILDAVNVGLGDMLSNLESISSGLSGDYYARAREALYGGEDQGLQYDEAKALAEEAWNLYQSDTWNQEYLTEYNARMDDLIGTLDDLNDTTKFESKQQQDWAKAVALYEIGEQQEVQDEAKSDIERQIELLEEMVRIGEQQTEEQIEAQRILDQIEAETKAGKDATYLVQDAVDDVELATEQVRIANDEIEQKKTEKFNLESTRWTQTGQDTYQVWTGETTGVGQKVYETVTEPTFGYVNESGEQIGFASGGYTGNVGVDTVAGNVHGKEYVLNAETTSQMGLNDTSSTGVFGQMASRLSAIEALMYEEVKTNKRSFRVQLDTNGILSSEFERAGDANTTTTN